MGGMNRCVAVTAALLLGAAATAVAQSVELNVPFVEGAGHKQQLDLYTPDGAGYPTILFVHGGSLYSGDRKDEPHERICGTFVELGIACAATSYRLAPDHKWPAQPDDVASAFAWLHRNIPDRGGDPDRLFLFGHSSGCLIVASLAVDEKYLARAGHEPADLAGVIPLGCRLDDYVEVLEAPPRRYEISAVHTSRVDEFLASEEAFTSLEQRLDAVPSMHVGGDLPPMLILLAEQERFFPPILRDAAEFVGRAMSANGDAAIDLVVLDDRQHMSALERMVTVDDPAIQIIREFVETGLP